MENGRLGEIARQWAVKADHDLEIVRRDLANKEPLTDILCFHCQQAAEKYLKAFLVFNGRKPSKTHVIEDLILECETIDPSFKTLRPVMYLSEYAVELRYPDDFYMPPIEQLEQAYKDTLILSEFVCQKMSIK